MDRVLISLDQIKDFVCNLKEIQKISSNQFPLIFTAKNIHIRKIFLLDLKKCGCSIHSLKIIWLNGGTLTLMALLFSEWLLK